MIPRTLFSSEHELFRESVRKFFEQEAVPFHAQWEKDGHIDRALWNKAGEAGMLCSHIPEEYGGMAADFLYSAVVIEEQARLGLTGVGFSLHSDIVAPYILHYGNEEQKQYYLPKLVSGELVTAIAMTEPGTGSDLQGVKTTAIRDGNHYVINGSKTYITNGQNADLILVCGANPTDAHPVFASALRRSLREGAGLIVIDPRHTGLLDTLHAGTGLHLQLRPGTNVAVLNALAYTLIEENLVNTGFVGERCDETSWLSWRDFIMMPEHAPEAVAAECGVPAGLLREAARRYGRAGSQTW